MSAMKTISVMIPCYNEVENAELMANSIVNVFNEALPQYDYEIVFIDNCSTDGTRDVIRNLCENNPKIKAIFNVTNFGQFNSPFYGICQTTGDCTISIACDFQEPVTMIPVFVKEWEKGHKIVSGIKTSSKESSRRRAPPYYSRSTAGYEHSRRRSDCIRRILTIS